MNKRQKETQQVFLDNEKAVLKKLEGNYQDALDEINSKIELLMARQDADMQHVIYQVEYQKALKTQVQSILETLQTNEFETVAEYLAKSYDDGFIGAMYDMHGQGIPLIFPIDQAQVVAAIQHETKLSSNLYTEMGHDIKDLQKKIAGEISRGISGGQMYGEITRNIASWARIPRNRAVTIARTEAHRIQTKAAMDAQYKAKDKGADVVKQWDASLDGKTRDSHRQVDGEFRELDEKFSNGLMYPGDPSGRPEEVINCRCALLQRARWALGNDYTKWSADAPVVVDDEGTTQFAIIEAKNYEDFQKKYKQASESVRKGKRTDYLVRNHDGATNTTKERIIANNAIARMPSKVQNMIHNGTIVDVGKNGASQYDYDGDILYVAKGATEAMVVHEIGHAVENKLINSAKLEKVRKSIVGEPTIWDIQTDVLYDVNGNAHDVFLLLNDNFVSDYQGRIYVENIFDAFDEDGKFKNDLLWEFTAEPYREYILNPENLKSKCPEMYDLIKECVE